MSKAPNTPKAGDPLWNGSQHVLGKNPDGSVGSIESVRIGDVATLSRDEFDERFKDFNPIDRENFAQAARGERDRRAGKQEKEIYRIGEDLWSDQKNPHTVAGVDALVKEEQRKFEEGKGKSVAEGGGDKSGASSTRTASASYADLKTKTPLSPAVQAQMERVMNGKASAAEVETVQKFLVAQKIDIGDTGKNHDGVDKVAGNLTKRAIAKFLSPTASV
jgi:hypothetical protein